MAKTRDLEPCLGSADPSVAGPGCALRRVLEAVGGKWKILLLCALDQEVELRYGELRRMVFGITNAMLANSLKELEADGLVRRHQYDEMPVRVEYSLTDKARTLIPILLELRDWGDENL
jgi:DNA-binding HxlR family transcriptional regulator